MQNKIISMSKDMLVRKKYVFFWGFYYNEILSFVEPLFSCVTNDNLFYRVIKTNGMYQKTCLFCLIG